MGRRTPRQAVITRIAGWNYNNTKCPQQKVNGVTGVWYKQPGHNSCPLTTGGVERSGKNNNFSSSMTAWLSHHPSSTTPGRLQVGSCLCSSTHIPHTVVGGMAQEFGTEQGCCHTGIPITFPPSRPQQSIQLGMAEQARYAAAIKNGTWAFGRYMPFLLHLAILTLNHTRLPSLQVLHQPQ